MSIKPGEGKVAIVTGGASGMGQAVARQFAGLGASVAIADITKDNGEALAKEIRDAGGHAIFMQTDVTVETDVERLVTATLDNFGRLDWAANMAGAAQAGGMFCAKEARDLTMAVNVMGTFHCVTAEARAMMRNGGGSIVNVSSVAGVQGSGGSPYYVAAKHAVIGFTKSAALELASAGIRVNVICPGITRTTMMKKFMGDALEGSKAFIPIGRLGEPDDQANAVIWLCSDAASFVTGASFHIDGGQTAGVPATLTADESFFQDA
jgi:NAD(P)-dependent dehydrogenase (short-subunit alcohol dehydrogenase family)